MPINTSGFRVSVLPQYNPVDPSLVAFDPMKIVNGANSVLKLASLYNDLAVQNKTMDNAIASANAMNILRQKQAESDVNLVKPRAELDLSKIGSEQSLVVPRTANELSKLLLEGKQIETGLGVEPFRRTSAIAAAKGQANRAESEESLKDTNLALSQLDATYKAQVDPMKHQLIMTELADSLKNAQSDADRKRALQDAEIKLKNAQAEQASAHADYLDAGGKPADPITKLSKIHTMASQVANEQMRLLQTKVPDPSNEGMMIPLASYISMTRQAGKPDELRQERSGFLWMNKNNVKTNPEAEALIVQLHNLGQQRAQLSDAAHDFFSKDILAPTTSPQTQVSPAVPRDNIPRFKNEAEAALAEKEGLIKKGQKINVNGVNGTWQ